MATPATAQTTIDITTDPNAPIDANQTTGFPVTLNISTLATSPGIGITKNDGGDLTINFNGTGAIDASGIGFENSGVNLSSFDLTSASIANPVISSTGSGIVFSGSTGVTGNFDNDASVTAGGSSISISGNIGGSFANTGALIAGAGSTDDGILISGTVGNGLTNAGQIGTPTQRVGRRGIHFTNTITGDFLNDTGGDIFSVGQGIYSFFPSPAIAVTGNFTNHANIDSQNQDAIDVTGFNGAVGGSFTNTGDLLAGSSSSANGIEFTAFTGPAIGNDFTNSGQIGTATRRVGGSGIDVFGAISGDFLNDTDGSIFSTAHGIQLDGNLAGNFTNHASIDAFNGDGIWIDGSVDGSFTNTGDLLTGATGSGFFEGINISSSSATIGNGFTNSGQIGTAMRRPDYYGIRIEASILGDFLNDTGGDIFSNLLSGIAINGVSGNFTNHAAVDSLQSNAIRVAANVGGTFTNTGDLLTGNDNDDDGIQIIGTVNATAANSTGLTNSGLIGTASRRAGDQGIYVSGAITGNFLNDTGGDIFSTNQGIFLDEDATTLSGDFTNNASVDSQSSLGIQIDGEVAGNFTNHGSVAGDTLGIQLGGLGGDFTNSGTITGANDDGVEITVAGVRTFENEAGATITGNGRAVEMITGGTNFTNAGTLNGNVVLGAASSGGDAGNVQNAVTLDSAGVINGSLDVGTSTATTVSLIGTGSGLLSTELTGGFYSGATANTINGSMLKDSTGQWIVDQDLTVGQGTTINNGNLQIAAGHTLFSDVDVNGGTLGGTGTIDGNVIVYAGGSLAPGNSPGTLTLTGDLSLAGQTLIEIASLALFDQVDLSGNVNYGGDIIFDFSFFPTVGDSFDIFDFTGQTGTFANINFSNSGFAGTFDYATGSLTVTAIPEPTTLALFSLASAVLLRRSRRCDA